MVSPFRLGTQESLSPALLFSSLLLMFRTKHAYQMLVQMSLKLIFGTCAWVTLNLVFYNIYYVIILAINFPFLIHSVNTV